MYTPNQLDDVFQNALGRPVTPFEIAKFSTASPQTLATIKDTYGAYNTNTLGGHLALNGQDNSPAAIQALGDKHGITNAGTTAGNAALLAKLKSNSPPITPVVPGAVQTAAVHPANALTDLTTEAQNNPPPPSNKPSTPPATEAPPASSDTTQVNGSITGAAGSLPNTDINSDPNVSAAKQAVNDALSSYQSVQSQVAQIDSQVASLREIIAGALQDKENQAAASGGVVSRSQIASEVAYQTQTIQNQINDLLSQRQPLAAQQSNLSGLLNQARQDYNAAQANFYKGLTATQGQEKINNQASQFDTKTSIQQQQFTQKLEQDGWKSTKVNQYDEYGDVIGQTTVWTQNPGDTTGFDANGNVVPVNQTNNSGNPVTASQVSIINSSGGIKWTGAPWQVALGATDSGISAADGGTFALWPSVSVAQQAQQQLFTSSTYSNLTLDAALKKWSGNSYGANDPVIQQALKDNNISPNTKVSDLTPDQVSAVLQAQETREGYSGNTSDSSIAPPVVQMGNSPTIDMSSPGYATATVSYTGKDTQLTQAYIDKVAIQAIMNGGVIPSSAARGTKGLPLLQTNAIKARIGQLDPGGNLQENKAEAQAWGANLTNQIGYASNLERSLQSADADLQNIVTTFSGKVNDQNTPISNIIANYTKYNLGSGDVSAYKSALAEIQRMYAQVFATGGSIQGTNVTAQDVIDGNISLANLQQVTNQLQTLGQIDVQKAYDAVSSSENAIASIVPGGSNGQGGAPQTISIGGQNFAVGSTITNSQGQTGIVNADGTITIQ